MRTYLDLWIRNLPENWDWSLFVQRINELHIRSAAFHTLTFCQLFMGTPLPGGLLDRLDPGYFARRRVAGLLTGKSLLENKLTMGSRYPTLVKLLAADKIPYVLGLILQAMFRKGRSFEFQGESISLFTHWKNVWDALRKGA